MSATSIAPRSAAPGAEQQARLERGERDGAIGRAAPGPSLAAPVSPSTPDGMSTASTGVPAGDGGGSNAPRNPVP